MINKMINLWHKRMSVPLLNAVFPKAGAFRSRNAKRRYGIHESVSKWMRYAVQRDVHLQTSDKNIKGISYILHAGTQLHV